MQAQQRDRPCADSREDHCAAEQLPRTGYSGLPQHSLVMSVCDVDRADISCGRVIVVFSRGETEIMTLKWAYVDLAQRVLRLPDSKTGPRSSILVYPPLSSSTLPNA